MRAIVSWSGGKDSALALQRIRGDRSVEVTGLLTTLSQQFDRISMHGVRRSLLEAQATALGLPVETVSIPTPAPDAACGVTSPQPGAFTAFPDNDSYEARMLAAFRRLRESGIEAVVFGDIFLEDLRAYRERLLAQAGLRGLYPLWGIDSRALVNEVIDSGFRATVVCVDGQRLDGSFCGRSLDHAFVAALPDGVDPCGENGEYHSFVHDGPGFRAPVRFSVGERVHRAPFWFCDLDSTG